MKTRLLIALLLAGTGLYAQNSLFGVPTPQAPVNNDGSAITVGIKFKASKTAVIQAIRFYKGVSDGTVYTLKLYKASNGQIIDSINYQQSGTTGWVFKNFQKPATVQKDSFYVAAVYSVAGNYATDENFYNADVNNGFLTAPAGTLSVPNGLYRYGNGIPNEGFHNSNYWVDVLAHDSASFAQGAVNAGWYLTGSTLTNANTGFIGINTATNPAPTDSTLKMAINGTVYAKKVKVVATGWADYVFDSAYSPISLSELKKYLEIHKHLPEVPSTHQVEQSGVDLGDMQVILLKKIEELTLYILEQEKRLSQQETLIRQMQISPAK